MRKRFTALLIAPIYTAVSESFWTRRNTMFQYKYNCFNNINRF